MIEWKDSQKEQPKDEGKNYLVCLDDSRIICLATWSNSLKRFFSHAFKGDNPRYWAEINYPEMPVIKSDFEARNYGTIADDDCNEVMPIPKE